MQVVLYRHLLLFPSLQYSRFSPLQEFAQSLLFPVCLNKILQKVLFRLIAFDASFGNVHSLCHDSCLSLQLQYSVLILGSLEFA